MTPRRMRQSNPERFAFWATPLLWTLSLALLAFPLLRYFSLGSGVLDLGMLANHVARFRFDVDGIERMAWGHLHGFMPVFSGLYRLFPSPVALLAVQSLLILAAALMVPVPRGQDPRPARLLYLGCYGTGFLTLADFHFDALAVPLMMGFYLALERGKDRTAALLAVLTAWVKEPFALCCAGMGLVLAWRRRRIWPGIPVAMYGILHFAIAVLWILPLFTPPERSSLQFFQDPLEALRAIPGSGKGGYVTLLLAAFGGIVTFFSPLELLPALPLLLIVLLSTGGHYWDHRFHYGAGLLAPFLASFVRGWPLYVAFLRRRGWAAMGIPLTIGLILAANIGLGPLFRWPALPSPEAKARRDLWNSWPRDPGIVWSLPQHLFAAPLEKARYLCLFPEGFETPMRVPQVTSPHLAGLASAVLRRDRHAVAFKEIWADRTMVDTRRPPSYNGLSQPMSRFERSLRETQGQWGLLREEEGLLILKRIAPPPEGTILEPR